MVYNNNNVNKDTINNKYFVKKIYRHVTAVIGA